MSLKKTVPSGAAAAPSVSTRPPLKTLVSEASAGTIEFGFGVLVFDAACSTDGLEFESVRGRHVARHLFFVDLDAESGPVRNQDFAFREHDG